MHNNHYSWYGNVSWPQKHPLALTRRPATPPSALQQPLTCSVTADRLLWAFLVNGIAHHVAFCKWLLSLSMLSRLSLAFSWISTSFLFSAEHHSMGWMYLSPFHTDPETVTESSTYRHTHVRPHPQPGPGGSRSGRTLRCWCSARSCRFPASGTRPHLPGGGHKSGPHWVNLTLFLSVANLCFHFQPCVLIL